MRVSILRALPLVGIMAITSMSVEAKGRDCNLNSLANLDYSVLTFDNNNKFINEVIIDKSLITKKPKDKAILITAPIGGLDNLLFNQKKIARIGFYSFNRLSVSADVDLSINTKIKLEGPNGKKMVSTDERFLKSVSTRAENSVFIAQKIKQSDLNGENELVLQVACR